MVTWGLYWMTFLLLILESMDESTTIVCLAYLQTMLLHAAMDYLACFTYPHIHYLFFIIKIHQYILISSYFTREHFDEMVWVSSSLTKVLGSNPVLGMQQC